MNQNFQNFSADDAKKLAQTPEGRQLITLLQHKDPAQLQSALQLAAAGDYSQAKTLLSAMLSSPEVRKLIAQLGGQKNG